MNEIGGERSPPSVIINPGASLVSFLLEWKAKSRGSRFTMERLLSCDRGSLRGASSLRAQYKGGTELLLL